MISDICFNISLLVCSAAAVWFIVYLTCEGD